jgi:hypothetical protein
MLTYRLTGTTEENGVRPERTTPSSPTLLPLTIPKPAVTANRIFASHGEPPRRLSNADLQIF